MARAKKRKPKPKTPPKKAGHWKRPKNFCPDRPTVDTTKVADSAVANVPVASELAARLVRLCMPGDRSCKGAQLTRVNADYDPPGYRYTQPDAIRAEKGGRTPTNDERTAYGCKKKGRGFTGENAFGVKDPFCKGSLSKPCGTDRFKEKSASKCPVQLIWKSGERHLRFCHTHEKAGAIIAVKGPKDALTKARKACRFWKKNLTWDGYAPLEGAQLGGPRPKKRRKRKR